MLHRVLGLPLKYTDITIDFLNGEFFGVSDITIDYKISNIGYHDVDLADINPTTKFYKGNTSLDACPEDGGTWIVNQDLGEYGILDALYEGSGTDTFIEVDNTLNEDGYICIYLNEQQAVSECHENNWALVNCDIPES